MTDARERPSIRYANRRDYWDDKPIPEPAQPPPACGPWFTDGSEPREDGEYLVIVFGTCEKVKYRGQWNLPKDVVPAA
jgi:hypothetical protein